MENREEIKISKYFEDLAINSLCEHCNWDIRDIRNRIIKDCQVPKNKDISRTMRKIKDYIKHKTDFLQNNTRINELLAKLKGEVLYDG